MIHKIRTVSEWIIILFAFVIFMSCDSEENFSQDTTFRVMSFNIRYNNPNDGINAWPNRKDMVADLIQFYDVDLLGVQEALHGQMIDLEKRLTNYRWIGVGRDDGAEKGEYSAIFFLKSRFKLEDHGTFWLSETPDEKGSLGWDASCVRIVTWARLTELQSGKTFYFFNTHFDHKGLVARKKSAKLLLTKTFTIAGDLPIIITGDFNSTDTSVIYQTLTKPDKENNLKYYFRDARFITETPPYGPDDTYNGFGRSKRSRRIDYVFVNEGICVKKHGILTENWRGIYPSDHMPVLADLLIQNTK